MPFMLRLRSLAVDPFGNCAGSAWAVAAARLKGTHALYFAVEFLNRGTSWQLHGPSLDSVSEMEPSNSAASHFLTWSAAVWAHRFD